MPTPRAGWLDTMQQSRLQHLTGSTYPSAPGGTYLALFSKMPLSDGSGGVEVTGTRPSITLSAPVTDANGRHYATNASAINSIALANASAAQVVGFGIYSAATGGTLYYADRLPPFQVSAGQTISVYAGQIKVYAEPPTV